MKTSEFASIVSAIIILTAVFGFSFAIKSDWISVLNVLLFSTIIIFVAVFSKKLIAYMLDSSVEHETWKVYRYGWKPEQHFNSPVSAGVILPLFFTLFTWGFLKIGAVLTYETRALKARASKRFGFYSFAEMTDWHNSVIGATGIIAVLLIALISYFLPTNVEYLAKMATLYAFLNMVPLSNLDGTQIFFGSRILYSLLAVITLIFTIYALIL
jgi:Zn-dependent protease